MEEKPIPLLLPACLMGFFSPPPKQELLDEEKKTMTKSRRIERSTSTFDFASYHTIDEVLCSAEHSLRLAKVTLSPCHGCIHAVTFVVAGETPLGTRLSSLGGGFS